VWGKKGCEVCGGLKRGRWGVKGGGRVVGMEEQGVVVVEWVGGGEEACGEREGGH